MPSLWSSLSFSIYLSIFLSFYQSLYLFIYFYRSISFPELLIIRLPLNAIVKRWHLVSNMLNSCPEWLAVICWKKSYCLDSLVGSFFFFLLFYFLRLFLKEKASVFFSLPTSLSTLSCIIYVKLMMCNVNKQNCLFLFWIHLRFSSRSADNSNWN